MLQAWLNKLGLPQYYDLFHEHHFGYDLLHTLTDEVSIGFQIMSMLARSSYFY